MPLTRLWITVSKSFSPFDISFFLKSDLILSLVTSFLLRFLQTFYRYIKVNVLKIDVRPVTMNSKVQLSKDSLTLKSYINHFYVFGSTWYSSVHPVESLYCYRLIFLMPLQWKNYPQVLPRKSFEIFTYFPVSQAVSTGVRRQSVSLVYNTAKAKNKALSLVKFRNLKQCYLFSENTIFLHVS